MKITQHELSMRERILEAAVKVAESIPLHAVTRKDIATAAGVAPSLVSYYMQGEFSRKLWIITAAIHSENIKVIAGASTMWPLFPGIPKRLKRKAMKSLAV